MCELFHILNILYIFVIYSVNYFTLFYMESKCTKQKNKNKDSIRVAIG